VSAFIDAHPHFGVEPVCRVLGARPGTYHERKLRPPSVRSLRDEWQKTEIERVWKANYEVYGARKVWRQLNREEIEIARCTVERLMRKLGIEGVRRGKKFKTTKSDPNAIRSADLVKRNFKATKPNQLWVTDFTYVPTWAGMVYVALVIDVFSRKIVGWRAATSMTTNLVLDALEMAVALRDGNVDGVIAHSDAGSQYTSITYTERLGEIGAAPSIGSVGDAYDNAMAESTIGLYKTELINRKGPWRNVDHVEIETLFYVDWFNNRRLHGEIDHIPPVEAEQTYYGQQSSAATTAKSKQTSLR
jgi:putative transposase